MTSDIERLAKESELADDLGRPLPAYPRRLAKFAALIANDCANTARHVAEDLGGVAEGPFVTDFGKHTKNSMAAGAINAAAAIRAKFALSGDAHEVHEAK